MESAPYRAGRLTMSQPCFLLDEHIPRAVARGMERREPAVRVHVLGQSPAPSISTSDPDLLRWIEEQGCLLVTNNRSTMPIHLREHLAAGRHIPGILIVPRRSTLGMVIEELLLIWGASLPDEYRDLIVHLPLAR